MSKVLSISFLLLLFTHKSSTQEARTFDSDVNTNKGTLAVREIRKCKSLSQDSARIQVRIFMLFDRQLKNSGAIPVKIFMIDTTRLSLNNEGIIGATIKRGWHKLGIDYVKDSSFSPFRNMRLKFKSRREYFFDIYLSSPFFPGQH